MIKLGHFATLLTIVAILSGGWLYVASQIDFPDKLSKNLCTGGVVVLIFINVSLWAVSTHRSHHGSNSGKENLPDPPQSPDNSSVPDRNAEQDPTADQSSAIEDDFANVHAENSISNLEREFIRFTLRKCWEELRHMSRLMLKEKGDRWVASCNTLRGSSEGLSNKVRSDLTVI